MKIATFNVENLDDEKKEHDVPLAVRIPILRDEITRLEADIICFQEVHGQELEGHTKDNPKRDVRALKQVLEGTPYEQFHVKSTLMSAGVPFDVRNLVIVSRYPIIHSDQYVNKFIPAPQYGTSTATSDNRAPRPIKLERPIQHCTVDAGSAGEIHVINLHLKSRISSNIKGQKVDKYTWRTSAGWAEGYFLSSIKRVSQALEARMLLDSLFEDDNLAKIVVCGDFNAEPGEVPVEAIAGRVENTNNPELRNRVLVSAGSTLPSSQSYTHIHHGHGNMLDHIMMSNEMKKYFVGARVLNEGLHDESLPYMYDNKYPESDHAPFIAEFRL